MMYFLEKISYLPLTPSSQEIVLNDTVSSTILTTDVIDIVYFHLLNSQWNAETAAKMTQIQFIATVNYVSKSISRYNCGQPQFKSSFVCIVIDILVFEAVWMQGMHTLSTNMSCVYCQDTLPPLQVLMNI